MTPVVIAPNQEAAGRTRQGNAPAQPCATRDSAQIKFSSTRVASTASQKAGYRIRVGKRAGDRQCRFPLKSDPASSGKNLPASFQSAHASRALMLGRHAYGLAAGAGQQAYQHEKVLADARNSKLAGLAAAVAGPQREG